MIFIKDVEFIRGNCPMTKEEVRVLSVTKLQLKSEYNVLDIGAGTGSVSIQICKLCPEGQVFAVERDAEALEVLYKNKEKFNAENLKVIEDDALNIEDSIEEKFDAIFVGGSGGSIEEIIKRYGKKLKVQGRMVLNFITIDNLYKAVNVLRDLNYEVECTQIGISKTKANSFMLMANNPIFIVDAFKKE